MLELFLNLNSVVLCAVMQAEGMTESVDYDQEQSGLGLHCLHRSVCLKT